MSRDCGRAERWARTKSGCSIPVFSLPRYDDGDLIGNKLFQPQSVPAVDRSWRQRLSNANCSMKMLFGRSEKYWMDVLEIDNGSCKNRVSAFVM